MSTYDPRRQGRHDGRDGKPPHQHRSAWNQREYDQGYADGVEERTRIEKERAYVQSRTADLQARIAALEAENAELRRWNESLIDENVDLKGEWAITEAKLRDIEENYVICEREPEAYQLASGYLMPGTTRNPYTTPLYRERRQEPKEQQ